jgi:hypothetical protein
MEKRGWKMVTNDLVLLFFGIQDAALMAENMVIAARSLGLGSCFLGSAMFQADKDSRRIPLARKGFSRSSSWLWATPPKTLRQDQDTR